MTFNVRFGMRETFAGLACILMMLSACSSPNNSELGDDEPPSVQGPALTGKFGPVLDWPLVATHAALLPDGKVISWYSYDAIGSYRSIKDEDSPYHKSTLVDLWDPVTNTHEKVDNSSTDLFCAGWTLLNDGRLLVAGGNLGTGWGSRDTNFFDSVTKLWALGPQMQRGRWYPSVIKLPNSEVLIIGGTDRYGDNPIAEVYQLDGTLRQLSNASTATMNFNHWYPWIHVAPNGLTFLSGSTNTLTYLNPSGSGSWGPLHQRDGDNRVWGSSVMYQPGKIIVIGGHGKNPTTTLIDITAGGDPVVSPGPNMFYGRSHLNATLLADGRIFVNGGNELETNDFDDSTSVYDSEIWNPRTKRWTLAARAKVPRNYHSTALLLPDATVWTAGGGGCGECNFNHLNYEIYYPPYLFKKDGSEEFASRPTISAAPATISYNQVFSVSSPEAASIRSATFISLGAVTHSFNMNQRFLELRIQSKGSDSLQLQAPTSPNLAPPGYYMLFLINSEGTPSVAKILKIQ